MRSNEELKTNHYGKLSIYALAPAKYKLVETAAPSGYLLDTTPICFDVIVNSSGVIAAVPPATFINQTLPPASSSDSGGGGGGGGGGTPPETGDENNLALPAVLLLLNAAGIIFVLYTAKIRKKTNKYTCW